MIPDAPSAHRSASEEHHDQPETLTTSRWYSRAEQAHAGRCSQWFHLGGADGSDRDRWHPQRRRPTKIPRGQDKAKINTQIGEASGLAKECAAAIISESPYPASYTLTDKRKTVTGLEIPGNCNNGDTATKPIANVTYKTEPATADGVKCGSGTLSKTQTCTITVNHETGDITYAGAAAAAP